MLGNASGLYRTLTAAGTGKEGKGGRRRGKRGVKGSGGNVEWRVCRVPPPTFE